MISLIECIIYILTISCLINQLIKQEFIDLHRFYDVCMCLFTSLEEVHAFQYKIAVILKIVNNYKLIKSIYSNKVTFRSIV